MGKNADQRIPLTQNMISEIESYKEKTGWGITALFIYAKKEGYIEETKSLNADAVNGWIQNTFKTVFPNDYLSVLEAYECLPPELWNKARALSRRKQRIPISENFRQRLNLVLDAKTMSIPNLLKYYGAPEDLRATTLCSIANGKNETIAMKHAEFLERVIEERLNNNNSKI